jgi:hypothetical protein
MDEKHGLTSNAVVTAEMIQNLPEPVQRYLTHTGVMGKPWIDTAHLKQVGKFRQGIDRPWMPMVARQEYTTNPPSFVWDARFTVAGLPLMRARDEYESGHGHMFGRIAGLFTVFDVRGVELDQGALMRYLSEMIWFPTAFLGENISWQRVDDQSARVTLSDTGRSVTGQLFFDEEGRVAGFTAMRYRVSDGEYSLDPWSTPITKYGVLAGLNLPVGGQAVWNLSSGDLAYVDLEVTDIEYNRSP